MKKDIFFFSGTHWDREWYQTFQGFRYRLVKILDDICDAWKKSPDFGTFHLDGQTIPLEDYAEIEPDKANKLKELVKESKIKIGPWYVMPDEFNISGESYIRNLIIGHKLSKKWGADEAWKFGYICDIFGHIAQTPQIFNGFGIKYSLFARGYYSDTEPYFVWRSPDGSEVINFRVGNRSGYGEFTYSVPENGKQNTYEEAKGYLKEYMDYLFTTTKLPIYVVMDALDHRGLRLDTTKYIAGIKEFYPEAEVHHTDLIEAGKMLEKYRSNLDVIEGEMNYSCKVGFPLLITNVLSSYYPLKKANDICQNRLEKVVEPLLVIASVAGKPMKRSFVDLAYKYLIQNQPHDSIGGCSQDQIHKDMEYRFDQALELCKVIENDYLYTFGRKQTAVAAPETDAVLTLFNTLPFDRDEVITVPLDMKQDYPTKYAEPFGYEVINSFKILDFEGHEIPYQVHSIKRNWKKTILNKEWGLYDVHNVTFRANVPAGGRSEYRIVPSEAPSRYLKHMVSGVDYMENDFIRVEIAPDGSISLIDKKTNRVYKNQLTIADDSEIGDGWFHANAREDRIVYSKSGRCRIEKIESGCARCVFRITKEIEVPKELVMDTYTQRRSDDYEVCTAVFDVGLSENARYADVRMTYDNKVKNHRVRLVIPTYTEGEKYFAGQAFYCCTRKAGIDYTSQSYREHEQYEKAMNGIVGKRDLQGTGLAFVSAEGLHECACTDDAESTLYVTLLRGFKRTVITNGQTRGQILGEHEFRFALVPVDSDITYADLVNLQSSMGVEIINRYAEIEKDEPVCAPVSEYRLGGNDICLSILKCAEDENGKYVARVFNASDRDSEAVLEFGKEIESATGVNLNEEVTESLALKIDGNRLTFNVTPWHIETVMIGFK